jgi:solute carrier family 50 protein (sugar transporter)
MCFVLICPLSFKLVVRNDPWFFCVSQNLVIKTKSVEYMPFYLSLSMSLMSVSFFAYGLLLDDFFIYVRSSFLLLIPSFCLGRMSNIMYICFLPSCWFAQLQIPNGIGTILGVIQLLLYAYFRKGSRDEARRPLLVTHT